ncbi:MAG: alpha-amylase family glycosyl hydrolase [Dorea sp.]
MWAYNSIFYQIYPIGFCGAPVHNDGVCVPRIRKLMDWSEYLQTLGIDSILLNPIFESDNHGYDTRDFKKIDCRLGTNEDFKEVCEDLHKHNVKIVLDGVFNHVGRGFWAFKDVQEKKWDSTAQATSGSISALTATAAMMTVSGKGSGWERAILSWSIFNLQNPAVVDYLMECVKYWIDEFDIDGLRLGCSAHSLGSLNL